MLKGLVSLVTGGAAGLGKETVQHLARQGGYVLSLDLPMSNGQEFIDSLQNEKVHYVPCDVTSESDVSNAISVCEEKFGRLDVAVNCAGLARAFKLANPFRDVMLDIDEINTVYESNLYGTFNVSRYAAQLMSKNEPQTENNLRGVIINTGSVSSDDGCIGQTVFSAAKAAISAMTLPMSRDLSDLGIRVLTIAPSLFETTLTSEYCFTLPVQNYFREQMVFPKRFGQPEEFSNMVEEIICNPYLNGEIIKLSGGLRFHCHTKVVGMVTKYKE